MALFCLRSFGATALFWLWSLFTAPHEHVAPKDMGKVALASFLGLFMTQLSFLFAITQTTAIDASILAAVPLDVMGHVVYVVVGATFIAYFLIPIGQKRLRPVVVCMYTYVQPVIAMVIALALGLDRLTPLKNLATLLVFTGVSLVNFVPKKR